MILIPIDGCPKKDEGSTKAHSTYFNSSYNFLFRSMIVLSGKARVLKGCFHSVTLPIDRSFTKFEHVSLRFDQQSGLF